MPQWLQEGYHSLVTDLSQTSLSDMESLGSDTAFRILWSRDELAMPRTAMPKNDGYWIDKGSVNCGNCHYNGRSRSLSDLTQTCASCGHSAKSSGRGVAIVNVLSLLSTTAETLAAADSTRVAAKIAEVFREELEDAERRNAS